MNAKKYVVAAILLNTVLLAFATSFWQNKRSATSQTALGGPSGKFGPTIETVLPAPKTDTGTEILNLETGRTLRHRAFDSNSNADAIMAGIRSNGLDISASVWSGGAACITYDMSVVAVDGKSWDEATEQELVGNPALSLRRSPRRMLVLGSHLDTYMFRTGEGTLGMLQLVGLSQRGQGVKIRYKLINPTNSLSVAQ